MSKRLRIGTFLFALLYCIAAMTGMLIYADHKAITIDNVAQDRVENGEAIPLLKEQPLRFRPGEEDRAQFCIPLESGIQAENITIENHYTEHQVRIYLKGTSPEYYTREAVFGNISKIEAGSFEVTAEGVLLKISLTDVYECKTTLEEKHLYIEFVPPKEMYEKIVVIDAAGGGSQAGIVTEGLSEKNLTLDISKRLRSLFETTDIKVYYTRMDDSEVAEEKRAELANAVKADMLISIRLNESEDTSLYGIEAVYNPDYFIPGFDSIALSDLLEKKVVTAVSGRGNGLYEASDSDILLKEARVPAAIIKVGYAGNVKEAGLLQKTEYLDRIAQGIFDAVLEAYEKE